MGGDNSLGGIFGAVAIAFFNGCTDLKLLDIAMCATDCKKIILNEHLPEKFAFLW